MYNNNKQYIIINKMNSKYQILNALVTQAIFLEKYKICKQNVFDIVVNWRSIYSKDSEGNLYKSGKYVNISTYLNVISLNTYCVYNLIFDCIINENKVIVQKLHISISKLNNKSTEVINEETENLKNNIIDIIRQIYNSILMERITQINSRKKISQYIVSFNPNEEFWETGYNEKLNIS